APSIASTPNEVIGPRCGGATYGSMREQNLPSRAQIPRSAGALCRRLPARPLDRHGERDAEHIADQVEHVKALAEHQPPRRRRAHPVDPWRVIPLRELDR